MLNVTVVFVIVHREWMSRVRATVNLMMMFNVDPSDGE